MFISFQFQNPVGIHVSFLSRDIYQICIHFENLGVTLCRLTLALRCDQEQREGQLRQKPQKTFFQQMKNNQTSRPS